MGSLMQKGGPIWRKKKKYTNLSVMNSKIIQTAVFP